MTDTRQDIISHLLALGAQEIDLSPTQRTRATEHYRAVGEYLAERESPLKQFLPEVFAQGSMAIDTATKPIGRDEFDVDLVCRLVIPSSTNPAEVKRLVGEWLNSSKIYRNMLREKNRCWRLAYAGEFHMDIIPSIPAPRELGSTALMVPDKELRKWKHTDPQGYAKWFYRRAAVILHGRDNVRAEVESAPSADIGAKSPLQIVVQLLKRHRDLMFGGDKDAPISIIITTLAARAYDGSSSIAAALSGVLRHMHSHVKLATNGDAIIENPVNPGENFADKWVQHPCRKRLFISWIDRARHDFSGVGAAQLPDLLEPLGSWVGQRAAKRAIRVYAETMQHPQQSGVAVSAATGELGHSTQAKISPPHTFYGR